MSDDIHQNIHFDCDPESLYRALTDQDEFASLTNAAAEIGGQPGDPFSGFGGMITGRHIELVPGRLIVQAWRVGNWQEGHYSLVTFELEPDGEGTRLKFRQSGHPDGQEEHLSPGWSKMYWEPLKAHLRASATAA